jgi:hypothetical protein
MYHIYLSHDTGRSFEAVPGSDVHHYLCLKRHSKWHRLYTCTLIANAKRDHLSQYSSFFSQFQYSLSKGNRNLFQPPNAAWFVALPAPVLIHSQWNIMKPGKLLTTLIEHKTSLNLIQKNPISIKSPSGHVNKTNPMISPAINIHLVLGNSS